MEPRFGRLYSAAVLRPFAEQLVAELGVRPGDTAGDVLCDAGVLGAAFADAVGSEGRVNLLDTDAGLLATTAREVGERGCAVAASVLTNRGAAIGNASCDRVGSLFTFGFWDGSDLRDEIEPILTPAGIGALLLWDVNDPPPHERALADALRDEAGMQSPFLERCLPVVPDANRDWRTTTLRDVVRFDGIAQYWAATVLERPVSSELAGASTTLLDAVRAACERALQPYIAADGTMRIPVTATMLRRRPAIDPG